jgi:hypothetical protein
VLLGRARLLRRMRECAQRSRPSLSTCISLREALPSRTAFIKAILRRIIFRHTLCARAGLMSDNIGRHLTAALCRHQQSLDCGNPCLAAILPFREPRDVACFASHHWNRGIVGTLVRGGGIGAILKALPVPLGSTGIRANARIAAAFGRGTSPCPVASSWPVASANEGLGKAKITTTKKATFTEVFHMRELPHASVRWSSMLLAISSQTDANSSSSLFT